MEDYIKTYNTIFILSNEINHNQLAEKDMNIIDNANKKLDLILMSGVGFAIGSTLIYHKLANKYFTKNIVKKCADVAFVLGFTSLTSYMHCKYVGNIKLDTIRNKYRYLIKNELQFGKNYIVNNNDNLLNHFHRFNNKHFYFIVFLIIRTLIK